MIVEDQTATEALLGRAETFGHQGTVEVIETHISKIFLVGERAYKLKRAVKLPYLDFSTPERRLATCEDEVRLNRRTAPKLYLGVRRITRTHDGGLEIEGAGALADAVVEMVRFDQEGLFDRLAERDALAPALLDTLADSIAAFHRDADGVATTEGAAIMSEVLDINEAGFRTSDVFEAGELARLNGKFRKALSACADRLDQRAGRGCIRRGHGDLHLRNICLVDGRPQLFDCIEFSEEMARIDTLYDLAFLLMDLWHRDLHIEANRVSNRYLDQTEDTDGVTLLPFFMAVRAAVRAHVTATQAAETQGETGDLAARARGYFGLADALLAPHSGQVVAIGGLSGSGKSSVAEVLAPRLGPAPGARLLESDRLRKRMFSRVPETHLGPDAYAPEVSERVYDTLCRTADAIAADGGTVLVDAVFQDSSRRDALTQAVRAAGVPFTGFWLDADPELLRARIGSRKGGASDATLEILEGQLRKGVPAGDWQAIDASASISACAGAIAARLR